MAEQIVPYALTARQRVKDRLTITAASFDTLIDRLISAMTDYIEGQTGRRFKQTTYTQEVYSVYGANPSRIFLKQAPASALTSFQYRTGLPSSPVWTDFPTGNYELEQDGATGIIRVYGGLIGGINQVRATYTAGYLIDFPNAGQSTHTLPFDLSDLCERLVVKLFKRRESEGRQSEAFEGGTVQWKSLIESDDQAVINRYIRKQIFF